MGHLLLRQQLGKATTKPSWTIQHCDATDASALLILAQAAGAAAGGGSSAAEATATLSAVPAACFPAQTM